LTGEDLLSTERQLIAQLAELHRQIGELQQHLNLSKICHRPVDPSGLAGGTTRVTTASRDITIVQRIIDAYRVAMGTAVGSTKSMWLLTFADIRRAEHDILMSGGLDSVQEMLVDPISNNLFYGFDNLTAKSAFTDRNWFILQAALCFDSLLTLGEAVGVKSVDYPEAPVARSDPSIEGLLSDLDQAFGFRIEFPNPFRGEVGLETSRGIASYRSLQSLYQGWHIAQTVPSGKVLEIGGGLGRTAYYAHKFGVTNYTIIDLPLTGAAQAFFLYCVGINVNLYKESLSNGIRIMPPASFYEGNDVYDLIVNVDGFTEMSPETMLSYFSEASRRTKRLLSINHEHSPHRVFDVINSHHAVEHATREPYWMRRGYMHEMVSFKAEGNLKSPYVD
jgi:hypothetical protein